MEPEKPSDGKDTARRANTGSLTLSWRSVAYGAILVAIGAVGTLIIVTTTGDNDVLATIALALAIVAFIIQIMVFVAQVFASNQQLARNEEIYAQVHGLLEGLRGTTQGTQDVMNTWAGHLIQAATTKASQAAGGTEDEKFDPEAFQQSLIEEVKKIARQSVSTSAAEGSASLPPALLSQRYFDPDDFPSFRQSRSPSPEDAAIIEQLQTYPDEESGLSSYKLLEELSPVTQNWLRKYAEDEISSRQNGVYVGLYQSPTAPSSTQLERHGLLENTGDTNERGNVRRVLSPLGREVARLLTAKGKTPHWLAQLVRASGSDEP